MSFQLFSRFALVVGVITIMGLLVACTPQSVRDFNSYVATNGPLARSGQMKWSDYFKGVYAKLALLPDSPRKAFDMQGTNHLIDLALDMEAGKMSKEQFDSAKRDFAARDAGMRAEAIQEQQQRTSQALAQQAAAWNQYTKERADAYKQQAAAPQPTYAPPQSRTINCTTSTTGGIVANTNCTEQ